MALLHGLLESVEDPALGPEGRIRGKSQVSCDLVRRKEPDPRHFHGKSVRVVLHHLQGPLLVVLEDAHRIPGADSVSPQEHHQLPDVLLVFPCLPDLFQAVGPDPIHLEEPPGFPVDDLEGFLPKKSHDAGGHDGTDSLDQPGTQVFADSLHRIRGRRFVAIHLELGAEATVVVPVPLHAQDLAGSDRDEVAHHGDGISFAGDLYLEDTIPVFFVTVGDSLHPSLQFLGHGASREKPRGGRIVDQSIEPPSCRDGNSRVGRLPGPGHWPNAVELSGLIPPFRGVFGVRSPPLTSPCPPLAGGIPIVPFHRLNRIGVPARGDTFGQPPCVPRGPCSLRRNPSSPSGTGHRPSRTLT